MKKHSLLERQLNKFTLSEESLPTDLESWKEFISRVNSAYLQADQDRYTLERSQELSSREMQTLFNQLEVAQKTARLGSFYRDLKITNATWSAEMYNIFEVDPSDFTPTREAYLNFVHPDDKNRVLDYIAQGDSTGNDFELEQRIVVKNRIRWVRITTHYIRDPITREVVAVTGTVLDITKHKINELREHMEHSVTKILSETDSSLDNSILPIMHVISENQNFEGSLFWKLETEKQNNFFKYSQSYVDNNATLNELVSVAKTRSLPVHEISSFNEDNEKYKSFTYSDLPTNQFLTKDQLKTFKLAPPFSIPLKIGNKLIGVIQFFFKDERSPDPEIQQSLYSIGHQISLYLERKYSEENVRKLNEELVVAARRAGMAEVATSVLHNIGNVLNSVNVSVTVVSDRLKAMDMNPLQTIITNFSTDKTKADYFLANPTGKKLFQYLEQLTKLLDNQKNEITKELMQLDSNIQHIKNIVTMQQSLSKALGLIETVDLRDLLEDALKVATEGQTTGLVITRQFDETHTIQVDKIRVLQILINLIRNAKQSVEASGKSSKNLGFNLKTVGSKVQIAISDNGQGIDPKNLSKIFSHGFTTKPDGHGFGLHISSLAAIEMGGKLMVASDGIEKGATFTLELPVKPIPS